MDRMGGKQLVSKVLVLLVIAAVAGAALGGLWMLPPGDADASGHSAIRSFSAMSVAPGDTVTVTIEASNFDGIGKLEDNVPAEFGGGTQEFGLVGGSDTVTYTVTAEDSPGTYTFSGIVYDSERNSRPVGGASMVTITGRQATPTPTPPPTPMPDPQPTASRSMPAWVNPGAEFTVTIQAANFGGLGRITETLPSGFASNGSGTVTLAFIGAFEERSYTVTAPDTTGTGIFSGTLRDADGNDYPVGGDSTVRVGQPPTPTPPTPTPPTPTPPTPTPPTPTPPTPTPPPANSAPAFPGETTSRSVQEDQSANMAIGAPVTATDPDGDSLTYTLGGSDAATFSIGRSSGQLMTRAALDYETKPSYSVEVTARDNRGGSDTIAVAVAVTNVEEQGTVTLNPDRPLVGTALTASLTDPDGGVTGETWRWSRSDAADGTFTGIGGATRASYTPVEADEGMYLKITVTYTDGHGPNKTATEGAMVSDPLIARYDANKDGTIEIRELFNAIDHYFDGTIELSELFKVIDYYFDG